MNWRAAFLEQAKSENAIRRRLNKPEIPYSHRLHYLQMVTEKLPKAHLANPASPPPGTHGTFVRFLQVIKGVPHIRAALGYSDARAFSQFIDSLLPLASEIQVLAPHLPPNTPNAECPWQDISTQEIYVPARFDFPQFRPNRHQMIVMDQLIEGLLKLGV